MVLETLGGDACFPHFFRTVILKLECTSVSLRGLVKTQISGLHPQRLILYVSSKYPDDVYAVGSKRTTAFEWCFLIPST